MRNITLLICVTLITLFITTNLYDCLPYAGLCRTSPYAHRVYYLMLHANILHLSLNIYAMLTLAFMCNLRSWHLFVGALLAITIPSGVLGDIPMVGCSTLIYAMAGIVVASESKWKGLAIANLLVIALQSFFVGFAVLPHLYCFCTGFAVGFVTSPKFEQ